MVAKFDRRSALLVRTDRLRCKEAMKTAGRENPIAGSTHPATETWCGQSEHLLLIQVGCEPRKKSGRCRSVFLDFYLYELIRLRRDGRSPKFSKSAKKLILLRIDN